MKIYRIYLLLILCSCMATTEKKEKSNHVAKKPTVSIYEEACKTCQLDIDIKRINLQIQFLDNNRKKLKLIQTLTHTRDSLTKEFNSLIKDYDNNIEKAKEICASSYPMHFEKDSLKRDTICALFKLWYQAAHPLLDTSDGYIPPMENGYYIVRKKGRAYKMKPSEYSKYIQDGLNYTWQLNQLVYSKRRYFGSRITGIKESEIDTLCIEMLGYKIGAHHINDLQRTIHRTDTGYQRYMKIVSAFSNH